jgi:hypothetical protein
MMGGKRRRLTLMLCSVCFWIYSNKVRAQDSAAAHQQMHMSTSMGWQFMYDGMLFAAVNSQGAHAAGQSSWRRTGGWEWLAGRRSTAGSSAGAGSKEGSARI